MASVDADLKLNEKGIIRRVCRPEIGVLQRRSGGKFGMKTNFVDRVNWSIEWYLQAISGERTQCQGDHLHFGDRGLQKIVSAYNVATAEVTPLAELSYSR